MRNKSPITYLLNRFALFGAIFSAYSVANVTAQSNPFANVSTRAHVQTGDKVVIAGFIINTTATTTKQVVIRGLGPSLNLSGAGADSRPTPNVPSAVGNLADPRLRLVGPDNLDVSNNNWRDTQENDIIATGLPPSNDLESAMIVTLGPGAYTVTLEGNNGGTGIGIVEIYDIAGPAPIVNLSTRAQVGTGNTVLIGGMIVRAPGTRAVVRAIGPSLGIQGALQNPTLELRDAQGSLIAANDNWQQLNPNQAEIVYVGLQPSNQFESAILPTLSAGNYTVIVKGVMNSTGIGLVELYALADAKYPRVFQAWANADSLPEDPMATVARHDLFWNIPLGFGWNWVDGNGAITENYESAMLSNIGNVIYPISTLRTFNPNIKILGEIRNYYAALDTGYNHLPGDHTWWKRVGGELVKADFGENFYLLDRNNPDLRAHVANRAKALMETGQFDGVILDSVDPDTTWLLPLLTAVRDEIGENGLIIVNANCDELDPQELNKVNGVFMECGKIGASSGGYVSWQTAKAALDHNETYITRNPKVNCLENRWITSRTDLTDLKRMRATTCLSLTHSRSGYALFADFFHNHMWYDPFWSNHNLGVPTGDGFPVNSSVDRRDFHNGTAIWNSSTGTNFTVWFSQTRKSLATGVIKTAGQNFTVPPSDGDIFVISY